MPTTTITASAIRVALKLSQSASREAGSPRLSISSAGLVSAKIATIGRIRKASATASAATAAGANSRRAVIRSGARASRPYFGGGPKPASSSASAP